MLTSKQRSFLSGMSKLLSSPSPTCQKKNRMTLPSSRPPSLLMSPNETVFDDSIYDSNQKHQPRPSSTKINHKKQNARRTQ
jgi:hypothetical protein